MNTNRIVITIDGLAGSGKSTLAALLAKKLGFIHFNSGQLYRAVGYLATREGVALDDQDGIERLIMAHKVELKLSSAGEISVLIDSSEVGSELRTPAVSEATSVVSGLEVVRKALLAPQRQAFPGYSLVAEGRDMGTVVFQDSPLKFFVSAPVAVRVRRRISQLRANNNISSDINELERAVQQEILERDERDVNRRLAPTVAASDSIAVDNSSPDLTQAIEFMYSLALSRGLARPSI